MGAFWVILRIVGAIGFLAFVSAGFMVLTKTLALPVVAPVVSPFP